MGSFSETILIMGLEGTVNTVQNEVGKETKKDESPNENK